MEEIEIRASATYRPWLGGAASVTLPAEEPVTLAQLLQRLETELPDFPHLAAHDRARLQAEVLVYDGKRFLRPTDIVVPGTQLQLLPTTAGG